MNTSHRYRGFINRILTSAAAFALFTKFQKVWRTERVLRIENGVEEGQREEYVRRVTNQARPVAEGRKMAEDGPDVAHDGAKTGQ